MRHPFRGAHLAGRSLRTVLRATPMGAVASALSGGLSGGGSKPPKKRRSKGLFLRKGRVFMGFTQKEVRNAMRRAYGGHARRKR